MPKITLADARPGMVLAQAIEDDLGRVVLGPGEVLTEQLIGLLAKRGHIEIQIRGGTKIISNPAQPLLSDARRKQINADLEARFANAGDNAAMQVFKKVAATLLLPQEAQS